MTFSASFNLHAPKIPGPPHFGKRADGRRRPRRVAKKIAQRGGYVSHAEAREAFSREVLHDIALAIFGDLDGMSVLMPLVSGED